jgi:predicted lipid-binding transport protein (Tim44 family)
LTVEIVLLAMIALFVGLRLYAVLGTRTGHEQQPVSRPEVPAEAKKPAPAVADVPANTAEPSGLAYEKGAAAGIGAIIAADPTFDVARFIEGAQAAYRTRARPPARRWRTGWSRSSAPRSRMRG